MSLERQYRQMIQERWLNETGHDDVKSAKNQVKIAMSALAKMNAELSKLNDEDSLPTWWTNKVAIAVDKLDGMADYLDTQVEEYLGEEQNYKVEIEGFPTMFMSASSPGQLKQQLRKMFRNPDVVQDIERVPESEIKRTFRLRAQGKEESTDE